jgi:FtsP/CotA-like multicopper oxidase with cupredoxin domain
MFAPGPLGAVRLMLRVAVLVSMAGTASAEPVPRVVSNDSRHAAGARDGAVHTLRLDVRAGQWHPDRDTDPGVVVNAFAEPGGAPQIPGPLLRVPEGTEVRVVVRNTLSAEPLAVHGFYTRPAKTEIAPVIVAPGEAQEIRFTAGAPGTYYYWAAAASVTGLDQRLGVDSQLSGAFIVDSKGAATPQDRVFVIGFWSNASRPGVPLPDVVRRFVMNGRSWPHTERLAYQVGEEVRIRVVNVGLAVHPVHLHGFYFDVASRGTEQADMVYPGTGSRRMAVTERLVGGGTFSLVWTPTRPGNWLFHCHDDAHLQPGGSLVAERPEPVVHAHHMNHALEGMAGPVIGISVTGRSSESSLPESGRRRPLTLVARIDRGGTDAEPSWGYTLEEHGRSTPAAEPYLPGPTMVLKRGEPVSITVKNQLPEATSVHWHGIELDSYYDGVPGFAGEASRIAPEIAPGRSFEARFTPPRSGTFIYHTHVDEMRQKQAGLTGALLVVDDPSAYDALHDRVLLVTVPRKTSDAAVVLLNGTSTPPASEMRVGEHYRLRLINAHIARPAMRFRLLSGTELLKWRSLAKDGMDLPVDQATTGSAEIQMGNGETYDYEFVPTVVGDIRFQVTNAVGDELVSMLIRVH